MLSIQSVMLVALGLLLAGLLAFVIGPAYRARIVRLTSQQIRAALPLSEAEIRADRDRLRAEYALQVHRLEVQLEEARLSQARQRIEINRRDAAVSAIEREAKRLQTELEAKENACHVLEQTIADRVPKVERRLVQAQGLLDSRQAEIERIQSEAHKTFTALDEAMQINAQLQAEIERLKSALTTRGARNRRELADPSFEGELALRSELEALRARTRDQASLIDRLQRLLGGRASDVASGAAANSNEAPALAPDVAALKSEIHNLETALRAAEAENSSGSAERQAKIRALESRAEDQAREIATLKASLAAYEAGLSTPGQNTGNAIQLKDNRIAMKARIGALETQVAQQDDLIRKLRAENASANDRQARQAQHFRDEMRRLGAGTRPAGGPVPVEAPQQVSRPAPRRSLAQRIGEAVPSAAGDLPAALGKAPAAAKPVPPVLAPARRIATSADPVRAAEAAAPSPIEAASAAHAETQGAPVTPKRPGRLLDRIARLDEQ